MTYKIKSGDTLTSIAREFGTTVDELARTNGIANKNLIYAGNTLNIPGQETAASPETQRSETKRAENDLRKWEQSRPEEYRSPYSERLDSLISALAGRSFSYDPKSDPVYESYMDSTRRSAELAMRDAAGKAAALSGGYGNSYAEGAGQTAYSREMAQLGDIIPELYTAALRRWESEGDSIESQLKLLNGLEDDEWDKYTDMMKLYLDEGDALTKRYSELSDEDYDRFFSLYKLLASQAK